MTLKMTKTEAAGIFAACQIRPNDGFTAIDIDKRNRLIKEGRAWGFRWPIKQKRWRSGIDDDAKYFFDYLIKVYTQ